MKKILLIIFTSLLIFNCSSDENDEQPENQDGSILYAMKETETSIVTSKIVQIDKSTGNETTVLDFNEYFGGIVFNNSTNEIIGINEDNRIYKINVENNSFTTIDLDNSENVEYSLVMDNNNELFVIKKTDEVNGHSQLMKINQENGNETLIIDFQENEHVGKTLTLNKSTNEIFAIGDSPTNLNVLYKINLQNNTFTTIDLEINDNVGYELLYGNSQLYAMKETENNSVTSELIQINSDSGNETPLIDFNEYIGEIVIDFSENIMFGVGDDNELFKINLNNNSFTKINLDTNGNVYYELALKQ